VEGPGKGKLSGKVIDSPWYEGFRIPQGNYCIGDSHGPRSDPPIVRRRSVQGRYGGHRQAPERVVVPRRAPPTGRTIRRRSPMIRRDAE